MTDNVAIVEYGSHTFRAGLAYVFPSDLEPRWVVPSSVRSVPTDGTAEQPLEQTLAGGTHLSDASLGHEPVVQNGHITHWAGFEALLHHALYQQAEREQVTQLAFEEFNMNGFFLCDQPVCSLYAVGKITGTVVDLGYAKTDVSVVAEGQVNYHNTKRLPYGGRDLDAFLVSLLKQRGVHCNDPQKLKEMCARASGLPAPDSEAAAAEVHTLPDGQSLTIEGEGQQLAQAIVHPIMLKKDLPDLPAATVTQIMQHPDGATRKAFAENILLCGGGSGIAGLHALFAAEMQTVSPPSLQPTMCSCPDYMPESTLRYSSWMGAAILSKLVFQQNQHITKLDYEEAGPTVVQKKCC